MLQGARVGGQELEIKGVGNGPPKIVEVIAPFMPSAPGSPSSGAGQPWVAASPFSPEEVHSCMEGGVMHGWPFNAVDSVGTEIAKHNQLLQSASDGLRFSNQPGIVYRKYRDPPSPLKGKKRKLDV